MPSQLSISAETNAALYGKGIFTTVAIVAGEAFLWEKHWARLTENAAVAGIDLSEFSGPSVKTALCDELEKNNVLTGRGRITFWDESPSALWPFDGERRTIISILTSETQPIKDGFRLGISPFPVNSRSPLTGVKSCNYLENIMARDNAGNSGWNEAVRVNEKGHVTSACMANIFWSTGGELYTPNLKTGCLAGTTREFVLENIDCREVEVAIDELECADTIFLTSAGLGVAPVTEFGQRVLKKTSHPILDLWPRSQY